MNTVLFKEASPSLASVIKKWFDDRPGILEANEDVQVSITTSRRDTSFKLIVDGIDQPSKSSLEVVLEQSTRLLLEKAVRRRARIETFLSLTGIQTLRALVMNTEAEILKYRNVGRMTLSGLREALTAIDSRLYFGMRLE